MQEMYIDEKNDTEATGVNANRRLETKETTEGLHDRRRFATDKTAHTSDR